MRKPEISIIVPNYNYGKYIDDALNSIAHQTFKNWECIVIDDGSTDDSVKIIKKYTKRDPRFKLIENEHGGVSAARNSGLDIARGDYIGFLDADDCFTDYALEMLLHLARTTGADMIGGATNIVAEDFKYMPAPRISWTTDSFGTQNNPIALLLAPMSHKWAWLWRRIYRRELIGDTRFHPEFTGMGDDLTFMLDICYRAKTMVETENISVLHRVQPNAITSPTRRGTHHFDWFPTYFQYIREQIIDKYDTVFMRHYYQNSFAYMLRETVFVPRRQGEFQMQGKQALLESIHSIPLKYLSFKQRILCRFLLWMNRK